jgi:hypothetical protein
MLVLEENWNGDNRLYRFAYRYESVANMRESVFLVRRIRVYEEEAASVAELELT